MSILKFKQFESFENDFDFPTFEDVEDYFYDFTDEIDSKLHGYQSGFKFYLKPYPYISHKSSLEDIFLKKSNYIDIVNTNITEKLLETCYNYCEIKNVNIGLSPLGNDLSLKAIRGGAKAYKHLMITLADTEISSNRHESALFSIKDLDLLIDCLKRFYLGEGFRPYGDLWTESYVTEIPDGVEERMGFMGMFVSCSDEEYIKMSELIEQRDYNKKLIKHFI